MTWKVEFHPKALRELQKLDPTIRNQLVVRLEARIRNPIVQKARLRGQLKDSYKIKLKSSGMRLVYQVLSQFRTLRVLAVGRRDSDVYLDAVTRGSSDP